MTISVNTPIVTSSAPTDTGAGAATTNGSPSTAGEFADALAGFLDGGPGSGATADGETTTDATTQTDLPSDAAAVPGAEVLAATPLWAANTEMLAAALAVTTAAGTSPQAPAAGSLLAAVVAPLAGTATPSVEATGLPAETAQPPASPVPGLATDASATALAATPAGAASLAAATGETTTIPAAPAPVAGATGTTATGGATSATGSLSPEGLDAQAAVTALGLTLTDQPAADTNTGAGTGSGAGTQVADPAALAAGADPAPVAAVGAAPVQPLPVQSSPVLAASAPAATAPRPVHVAHQVATQVATLTGAPNGVHTMTIQITPDDLGPVQVQVTLADGAVDMTVLTALEVGRDTITQAAPDLRRYLEAAGLTCNSVEVDLSNDQSSWLTQPDAEQNFEERKSSNGREQAGTPSGDIDDSPTAGAATRSPSSTSTGVDLHI